MPRERITPADRRNAELADLREDEAWWHEEEPEPDVIPRAERIRIPSWWRWNAETILVNAATSFVFLILLLLLTLWYLL